MLGKARRTGTWVFLAAMAMWLVGVSLPGPPAVSQANAQTDENASQPEPGDVILIPSDDSPGGENPSLDPAGAADSSQKAGLSWEHKWSLITLLVGIVVVLGLIIGLKVNAFIALITAAIVVSLMAGGDWASKIARVASAFGSSAGSIGIVIAMAAVIGKCMLDSGAADRVVRAFLNLLGEKRSPMALMGSGFVLAVPVFFDTVFYLLVPLARSLFRKTNRDYLKYILAIGAGGAITHTLVPPTPGPLMMASNLGFDVGIMIMVGSIVALPAALAGLIFAGVMNRLMPVPMRQIGSEPEPEPLKDEELPSLFMSLLPVVLPVVLISTNTVLTTLADAEHAALLTPQQVTDWPAFRAEIVQQADASANTPGGRILDVIVDDQAKDAEQRRRLEKLIEQQGSLGEEERQKVVDGLNKYVLGDRDFYDEKAFVGMLFSDDTKGLLAQRGVRMKKVDAERLNRLLLEEAFNTPERQLVEPHVWDTTKRQAANISSLFGNANLALLLSAVIAMWVLVRQRQLSRKELAHAVEISLMSGGVIILITAGGGAFGAMLQVANVGEAIKSMFQINTGGEGAGLMFLVLGFAIAVVLKIAQGSSTVAMITGSAMLAGIAQVETLGFHPVYLATAIGGGSLVGSWMNDSGFWIFAKMGGLTETEALKSWTVMLSILGVISFAITVVLAMTMPLTGVK